MLIEDTKGLTEEEIQRAIRDFLKERERLRIASKKRREKQKAIQPTKEAKQPKPRKSRAGVKQKSYYVPTGRPRGRPRKAVEEAPSSPAGETLPVEN